MSHENLRKKIDARLKDYGVDWKLDDEEYYEHLLDEIMMVVEGKL